VEAVTGQVLVAVMLTHIILEGVDLDPFRKVVLRRSHPARQCILLPLGHHQTVLERLILTAMVHEHQLGMLLHILLILTVTEEGRQQRGMLVLKLLILMRQDQMGVPLVLVPAQVGVVLLLPELVVGRHRRELHRPLLLLLLHLHGVHLLRRGVLLREQP
jgi:hypothetical protein